MTAEKKVVKAVSKSPAELIAAAVSKDTDLDKLEKLLVLQERWEGNEAKKAYHKAMSEFKANPPKIEKDKTVSYGNTSYKHATLANITDKVNTELSKHGLSATWATKQNGNIMVTCKITHVLGHSEETTLAAGADTSGSKNAIQAIGSAITYLQRYTLLSLTGLAAHDTDDDGQAATSEKKEELVVEPLTVGAKKVKQSLKVAKKKEPSVDTPVEEKDNKNLSLNQRFAVAKKTIGDEDYFLILGKFGVNSISQIKKKEKAEEVLKALEDVSMVAGAFDEAALNKDVEEMELNED